MYHLISATVCLASLKGIARKHAVIWKAGQTMVFRSRPRRGPFGIPRFFHMYSRGLWQSIQKQETKREEAKLHINCFSRSNRIKSLFVFRPSWLFFSDFAFSKWSNLGSHLSTLVKKEVQKSRFKFFRVLKWIKWQWRLQGERREDGNLRTARKKQEGPFRSKLRLFRERVHRSREPSYSLLQPSVVFFLERNLEFLENEGERAERGFERRRRRVTGTEVLLPSLSHFLSWEPHFLNS